MAAAGEAVVAATALVRVGGRPAGSAVLVDKRHLLTAGHVVQSPAGGLQKDPAAQVEVRAVFPRLASGDGFVVTVLDVPEAAAWRRACQVFCVRQVASVIGGG